MHPGVMVGSSVWVVSGRWARLVVWCSVCVASAGYLRCACWCRCVNAGGLSACLSVELVPGLAAACVRGWVPLCVAVVVGVSAPGAWWAWLGAAARVDVYLVWAAGVLRAAGALLPCVWRPVLSGGALLVYALLGRCWCGCLGLGAGCGRVVCAAWWGVLVGSLTCVAGWWRVWSGRCGLGGGGGCGSTAWWLWCRWAAWWWSSGVWWQVGVYGGGGGMLCHCGCCWVSDRLACGL